MDTLKTVNTTLRGVKGQDLVMQQWAWFTLEAEHNDRRLTLAFITSGGFTFNLLEDQVVTF